MIDPVGAAIRLSVHVSPRARAYLDLRQQRRAGNAVIPFLEHLVQPGDTVLDIGARWGTYTLLLAGRCGPNGRVYAFEPNPEHRAALASLARKARNLDVRMVAVSDETGKAILHIPLEDGRQADGLASLAEPRDPYRSVEIERLLIDDLDLPRVNVLKIDVEGHELAVLRGAQATLRRHMPALVVEVEERHRPGSIVETSAYLAEQEYDGYAIYRDGVRPIGEFDVDRDQSTPLQRSNSGRTLPAEYVNDFFFVHRYHRRPSDAALVTADTAR